HTLAGGLGDLKVVGVKAAEHVAWQTFIEQGGCEQIDDAALERAQIRGADGGDEEREQRARVGDQETLAPVEPEQVRIPVVALWRLWGAFIRLSLVARPETAFAATAGLLCPYI